MHCHWVPIAAALCALGVSVPSADGETSVPPTEVKRVLHICDCIFFTSRKEREALLLALAKLGYVQGGNLDLTTYDSLVVASEPLRMRKVDPSAETARPEPRAPARNEYAVFLARQLPSTKTQLILASGVRAVQGAKEAAPQIPVIFWRVTDPVGFGLVESFAQPGGNLTGFSRGIDNLTIKRFELLHEMLPNVRKIGFVFIADNDHHQHQAGEVRKAAESLGLAPLQYGLPLREWTSERLEDLFARMRQDGIEAFLLPDMNVQGQLVVALAAKYRLPTVHASAYVVTEWGGLASYTTVADDELSGVAQYAVRVFKGERPRDLPVQEPVKYELLLNARAARDIGVSFPSTFMLRATQVVEK